MDLDLTYTVLSGGKAAYRGSGRTIDWSSAGLRFAGDRPIGVGRKMEVSVQWPITLDDGAPLKVVLSGECIRTSDYETALRITGYEFRTRGSSAERRVTAVRPNQLAAVPSNATVGVLYRRANA